MENNVKECCVQCDYSNFSNSFALEIFLVQVLAVAWAIFSAK